MSIRLIEAISYFEENKDRLPSHVDSGEFAAYVDYLKSSLRSHKFFEFGTCRFEVLNQLCIKGMDAFYAGRAVLPFDQCVIAMTVDMDDLGMVHHINIADRVGDTVKVHTIKLNPNGEWQFPQICANFRRGVGNEEMEIDYGFMSYLSRMYCHRMNEYEAGEINNQLMDRSFIWGLLDKLNDRDVVIETVTGERLNKSNKGQGNQPIPDYNVVKIAPKIYSSQCCSDGDGTPKRTHERRGHLRRYRDQLGTVVKEVPVRSMIINPEKNDQVPPGHYVAVSLINNEEGD